MKPFRVILTVLLLTIALTSAFVVNTRPIEDGDTWWQIAYGKYMVENNTIVPDHTIYSWSPVSPDEIYCAWTSEIIFFLTYNVFGTMGLFVVRYLIVILIIAIFIAWAIKNKSLTHPITGLALLMSVLIMSKAGTLIKPEMFSLFFMTLIVALWWVYRSLDDKYYWVAYIFPFIMLVWVNSHGGFIFGFPFLVIVLVGDIINYKFHCSNCLSPYKRKHFYIAIIVSLISFVITPYGVNYPLNIIKMLFSQSTESLIAIGAYHSPLDIPTPLLYFIIPSIILSYLFIISFVKTSKIDFHLLLVNICFAFLYTKFMRTTYFWAPILFFTVIDLLHNETNFNISKSRFHAVMFCSITLFIALDQFRWAAYQTIITPAGFSWFGFGNSYLNSQEETEYVKKYFPNRRVGNDYNNGGYMLWRLYPDSKIMMDPRYFPYKAWFNKYLHLSRIDDISRFFADFNCDVFNVPYQKTNLLRYFLTSSDWKIAFYGSGGVVFVKKEIKLPGDSIILGEELYAMKNPLQAMECLSFSLQIRDWKTAIAIYETILTKFTWSPQEDIRTAAAELFNASISFYQNKFSSSYELFSKYWGALPVSQMYYWANCYYLAAELWDSGQESKSMDLVKKAVSIIKDDDPYAYYNQGVITWWLLNKNQQLPTKDSYPLPFPGSSAEFQLQNYYRTEDQWKKPLTEFIEKTRDKKSAIVPNTIARRIVEGTYTEKPPLIHPTFPKPLDGKEQILLKKYKFID